MLTVIDRVAGEGKAIPVGDGAVTEVVVEECVFNKLLNRLASEGIGPVNEVWAYCDGSARPQKGHGGFGIWAKDDQNRTYDMWGYVGDHVTNNRAELYAYIRLLEAALAFKWKKTTIFCDSEYVLFGSTQFLDKWTKNGWLNSKGNIIDNLKAWRRVLELKNKLCAEGQEVIHDKVKSHSGIDGNERADANADRGRLAGVAGSKDPIIIVTPAEDSSRMEEVNNVVTARVKKEKRLEEYTRLLAGKRLVFCTNVSRMTPDGYYVYHTSNFEDKLEDEGKRMGNLSSEDMYSVVLMKEPIKQINAIMEYQDHITPDDFQQPVIGILPRIMSPANWNMLTTYGRQHLKNDRMRVTTVEGETLAAYIHPPRNGYDGLDILGNLLDRLDYFRFGQTCGDSLYIDITHNFFMKNKSKWSLIKEFPQQDKALTIEIEHANKTVPIILTLGVDIPSRNHLSGIAKESKDISVHLIMYDIRNVGFRYSVVIKSDDNYGIYSTPMANFKNLL